MNHLQKLTQGIKTISFNESRLRLIFELNLAPCVVSISKRTLKITSKREDIKLIARNATLYHIAGFNFSSIPEEGSNKSRDPVFATYLFNEGRILKTKGQLKEALDNFRRSLEIRRSIYQGNHKEIEDSLWHVGFVLRDLEKSQEVIDYLKEALKMNRCLSNDDPRYPLVYMDNIGNLLRKLGRSEEALYYFKQSLDWKKGL